MSALSIERDARAFGGPESGATLVELLVYLSIAATILLLVNTGIRSFGESAQRTVQSARQAASLELALNRLGWSLLKMDRVPTEDGKNMHFIFSGTETGMAFPVDDATGTSASSLTRISVVKGSDGDWIIQEPGHRVFASASGSFTIRFSYRATRGRDTGWVSRWPEQDRMPDMIRIGITDRTTGRDVVPAMLVAPERDAEPECNDPHAPVCTISSSGEITWTQG